MKKTLLTDILHSFKVIPEAFAYLISRPRLYVYIIIPVVMNIILAVMLWGFTFNFFQNLTDYFLANAEFEGFLFNLIYGAGSIISSIIAFLITWFLITSIGIIIQSPFNGQIVEFILDEKGVEGFKDYKGIQLIIFEFVRSIKFESAKITITILVFVFTFVLNFIPVVGSFLYAFINIANIFFLNLLDLLDPCYSRVGMHTKQEIKATFKNLPRFVGFGTLAYLVWGIPIINFLLMPLLFTSAALSFVKISQNAKQT
jgi:CysZ protein